MIPKNAVPLGGGQKVKQFGKKNRIIPVILNELKPNIKKIKKMRQTCVVVEILGNQTHSVDHF